jgi:alpha-beta hydrolase superfamily lysophospholipase
MEDMIMLMNEIQIKQEDGYITTLFPYYAPRSPKGSILVLHGMAEYHDRYIGFAEFLNECGYDVYLYDHRGHGTGTKLEDLGFFAAKDGYNVITLDAPEILNFIKANGRSEHLILFGHSMGSLLARNVIQYDDSMDCAIICGTNSTDRATTKAGLFVSGLIKTIFGATHPSPFLNKLMFNNKYYNKLNERTQFDWLTRNSYVVGQYIGDPYCGFLCTASMYNDILHLVDNDTNPSRIQRTRKNLPIFVISGELDPVGSYGKDVVNYVTMLQKLGFSKVDCTLYSECRHELLNELNNQEIMHDIVKWIDKRIAEIENAEDAMLEEAGVAKE